MIIDIRIQTIETIEQIIQQIYKLHDFAEDNHTKFNVKCDQTI